MKTAWQYGAAVARHGPTVTPLAPLLGLTATQIDDIFLAGAAFEI